MSYGNRSRRVPEQVCRGNDHPVVDAASLLQGDEVPNVLRAEAGPYMSPLISVLSDLLVIVDDNLLANTLKGVLTVCD